MDIFDEQNQTAFLPVEEYNPMYHCLLEQGTEVTLLSDLVTNLNAGEYAFFDLPITDVEWEMLQLLDPQKEENSNFYGNLEQIKFKLPPLLKQLSLSASNTDAADQISNIIVKLISFVLASANKEEAEVSIRNIRNEPFCSPCWHIDKTHSEVIDKQQAGSGLVYILPLKGEATLYQPVVTKLAQSCFSNTEFDYTYNTSLPLCEALDMSQVRSVAAKQGSVHISGFTNGTIHAIPDSNYRFLLVITPTDRKFLPKLKEFDIY